MNRVRDFVEKLLYTGMKPGAPGAPAASKSDPMRWLGPLRAPLESFLSGGPSPTDPLYLTRRTSGQKALRWGAIGLPFVAMVTVLFLAASGSFSTPPKEEKPDSKTSIAATLLPNYKDVEVKMNRDIVVLEARLDRSLNPVVLWGTVKNVSGRTIESADIVFDLTNREGSQIGGYTITVQKIRSQETGTFRDPVKIPGAAYALVREVIAH
jgi:hypothetical protein